MVKKNHYIAVIKGKIKEKMQMLKMEIKSVQSLLDEGKNNLQESLKDWGSIIKKVKKKPKIVTYFG